MPPGTLTTGEPCSHADTGAGDMTQLAKPVSATGSRNFALVTALRGIAASWVVLFHLMTSSPEGVNRMPRALAVVLFHWGKLGVPVFFTLSGFVIMHSLRNREVDRKEMRSFMRRRFLRIAPPYYAAIVVVLAVGALGAAIDGGTPDFNGGPFTFPRLLAHLAFAQQFLGIVNFEEIFWTLCFEMGFYLLMILLLAALTRTGRRSLLGTTMIVTGAVSLALTWAGTWNHWTYLVSGWYMFAAGVLAYLAATSRCPSWYLWMILAGLVAMGLGTWTGSAVAAALTALALYADGRLDGEPTGLIATAISSRPLIFLGTVSYSLYLFHAPVRTVVLHAWTAVFGGPVSVGAHVVLFAAQFGAAVLSAWVLFRLIEKPSMRWASRR